MRVSQKQYDEMVKISDTILSSFSGKSFIEWEDIVSAVSSNHKIRSNGWMMVRSAMQTFLISTGKICRTNDVHSEIYVLTN